MAWFDYLWLEGKDGNIAHIAEHDLSPDDIEHVIENYIAETTSRSSARPIRFGFIEDGSYIAVVFEWVNDETVYPITAYEVEE